LTFSSEIRTKHCIMGAVGPGQIIVIALIVLLLFGGRKIPELMKGLGKGVKEFKDATNPDADSDKEDKA
jgi:sec-independent protein translocase protein TatA